MTAEIPSELLLYCRSTKVVGFLDLPVLSGVISDAPPQNPMQPPPFCMNCWMFFFHFFVFKDVLKPLEIACPSPTPPPGMSRRLMLFESSFP